MGCCSSLPTDRAFSPVPPVPPVPERDRHKEAESSTAKLSIRAIPKIPSQHTPLASPSPSSSQIHLAFHSDQGGDATQLGEDRDVVADSLPLPRMVRKASGLGLSNSTSPSKPSRHRPPPRRNTSLYFNELTTTLMMDGMGDGGGSLAEPPPERGATYHLVSQMCACHEPSEIYDPRADSLPRSPLAFIPPPLENCPTPVPDTRFDLSFCVSCLSGGRGRAFEGRGGGEPTRGAYPPSELPAAPGPPASMLQGHRHCALHFNCAARKDVL